jgi:hypothetical protein
MLEYQKTSKIVTVMTDATQERKKPRRDHKLAVKMASKADIKKPGSIVPMVNIEDDWMTLASSRLNGCLDSLSNSLKHTNRTRKTLPHPKNEAILSRSAIF